jgi:hypothetical protein
MRTALRTSPAISSIGWENGSEHGDRAKIVVCGNLSTGLRSTCCLTAMEGCDAVSHFATHDDVRSGAAPLTAMESRGYRHQTAGDAREETDSCWRMLPSGS